MCRILGCIFTILLGLSCCLTPARADVTCSTVGGNYSYNGTITWARDTPVGTVSNKISSIGTVWAVNCTNTDTADRDIYWKMTVGGSPVAGYSNVYPTNISGVGVRYNFALNSGSASFCNVAFDDHIDYSTRTYTCHIVGKSSQAFSLGSSLQFIKLSDGISSGVITYIPPVDSSYSLNNQSGSWGLNRIWGSNGNVVLNITGCSISTPSLNFPIGDVASSKFSNTVGYIPSGAQNTQYLGLSCSANININVMLQGTRNPDVSNDSVLALTGQGSSDVAKGVGVQLLYNGTPLKLNNRIVLKKSSGGQETFPLVARYYQTKTDVTTGKANASATLDLTYQ